MPCPQTLVRLSAFGPLAAMVMACAAATPAPAAGGCEALRGWATGSARVLAAERLTPPASVDGVALSVPLCRVQGVARPAADSDIRFEVWLPDAAAWSGRYKQNGTGGFAGHTLNICGYIAKDDLYILCNPAVVTPGIQLITAADLKNFWRSNYYGAQAKAVLSRPAFVINQH